MEQGGAGNCHFIVENLKNSEKIIEKLRSFYIFRIF